MKKNNLLKVLGITFLIVVVLTWLIPVGGYTSGAFTKGDYSPVGLLDLIRIPLATLTNYSAYVILFLVIGGFYGVLNKTGVYTKLVDTVTKKFKGNEKKFAIISILFFAILSSVTGLSFVLLILVPFALAILLSLGFSKVAALMATVGSILIGNVASTYGFNIVGQINYYFDLDINQNVLVKIILFVMLVFLTVMYVLKHNMLEEKEETTKKKEEEKKSIPLLGKEINSNKSIWPLVTIFAATIVFLFIALYNWRYAINFTSFEDLYETIVGVEIKGYPILANILGSFNPLGYWGISEVSIVLVIVTLLIGWIYSVKCEDFIDAFVKGMKEMLPVAFFVALANVVMMVMFGTSEGTSIYYTISNFILSMAEEFNVIVVSLFTAISGLFVNDFSYLVGFMAGNVAAIYTDATVYPLIGLIFQAIHGIVMLFVPTSLILIAGLAYLKVSYKEWLKYIWKFLLEILAVCALVFLIVFIFI